MQRLLERRISAGKLILGAYEGDWKHAWGIVFGRCSGWEKKTTTYGESVGFIGSFRLDLPELDSGYQARRCFLPRAAEDALLDACEAAQGAAVHQADLNGGDAAGTLTEWHVDFAFKVSCRPKAARPGDDGTGAAYEWVVEPVVQVEAGTDPLTQLAAEAYAGAGVKQLTDKAGK